MRRRAGILAMVVISLALSGTTAQAALVDANCPGPSTGSRSSTSPNGRDAQTFTALHTGTVVAAHLEITKLSPSTDFQLQLLATNAAGVPVNGVLASTTIPDAFVLVGNTTLIGYFTPPPPVVAGQQYALVVTRPGGATYSISERTGNPCPGSEFASASQTGAWSSAPDSSGLDHLFHVFVNPPNDFTVGKAKRRKLPVTVPGAGLVALGAIRKGPRGPSGKFRNPTKLLRVVKVTAATAGQVLVPLRLTNAAKAELKEKGKLKLSADISFYPDGGNGKSIGHKLTLK